MESPDPEEEITLTQAEMETGIARQTFRSQIYRGRIPAVLEGASPLRPTGTGLIYLIKRRDLDAYLATRARTNPLPIRPEYVPSVSHKILRRYPDGYRRPDPPSPAKEDP